MTLMDQTVLEELSTKQLLGMIANRHREERDAKGWVLRRAMKEEREQLEAIVAKRRKS